MSHSGSHRQAWADWMFMQSPSFLAHFWSEVRVPIRQCVTRRAQGATDMQRGSAFIFLIAAINGSRFNKYKKEPTNSRKEACGNNICNRHLARLWIDRSLVACTIKMATILFGMPRALLLPLNGCAREWCGREG